MRSGFAAAGDGFAAMSTADAARVADTPSTREPRDTGELLPPVKLELEKQRRWERGGICQLEQSTMITMRSLVLFRETRQNIEGKESSQELSHDSKMIETRLA